MKTRPQTLTYLSIFLIGIAASLPLQIMFLYGHTPLEMKAVLAKLTPLNWIIIALCPVSAWFTLRASTWVLLTMPLLSSLIVYNNWFVAEVGNDFSALSIGLSTGAYIMFVSTIFTKAIIELILYPQKRWWLTPLRQKSALPVRMSLVAERSEHEFEYDSQTFDVSTGGAFIVFDRSTLLKAPKIGTRCYIRFTTPEASNIECRAEVVRHAEANGNYPAGIGVRFLNLNWNQRRVLSSLLKETVAVET